MAVIFVSTVITVLSGLLAWLALTSNPFAEIFAMLFCGTLFLSLVAWGINVNKHKEYQDIEDENRQSLGIENTPDLKEKLEDDLALMCAIYNKIHVSYKECAQRDAWLIVDKAEGLGIDLNMNTVDAIFYDKINNSNMNAYLHRAMAEYTSLDYISIYG